MSHKIYEENGKLMIERLEYPRFKAEITFDSDMSDIENTVWIDKCNNPLIVARAMREAGEYIWNYRKGAK